MRVWKELLALPLWLQIRMIVALAFSCFMTGLHTGYVLYSVPL